MEDEPPNTNFPYTPLCPGDHDCIRLLIIFPKPVEYVDNTSPIRCPLTNVHICKCHLAPGIPEEALLSRAPSVNFHAQVTNRPTEIWRTPHALGLVRDSKAGRIRKNTNGKPWLVEKREPAVKATLPPAAILANLVGHPEDHGGGRTIAWSISDDDDYDDDAAGFSKLSNRVRRRLKKFLCRWLAAKRRVQPPTPLQRQACGPKFSWGNYVALSYEWGDGPTEQIFIEHCSAGGHRDGELPFVIHKNLHAALRRLRVMPQFGHGCRFWADSICITQNDAGEKHAQMKIMSSIYQRAGNILVWLGEGDTKLYQSLDVVQECGRIYRTEFQEAYDGGDPNPAFLHQQGPAVDPKIAMERIMSLARTTDRDIILTDKDTTLLNVFFSLTYWRRLWMIQELVMGKADMAVVLGERVTEWRYIRDTAFVLAVVKDMFTHESIADYRMDFAVRNTIVHIAKFAQLEIDTHRRRIQPTLDLNAVMPFTTHLRSGPKAGPQRGDVLWQVFRVISYARCTYPEDRVFGILALPCLPNLGTEHGSKEALVQVYGDFATACMNVDQDPLGFFCLIDGVGNEPHKNRKRNDGMEDIDQEKLPSWIPNLSSERETGIIEGTFRAGYPPDYEWNLLAEDGWEDVDARPQITLGVDRTLHISGFVIDAVDGLGDITWSGTETDSDYEDPGIVPDLIQPTRSPPWCAELISHQAAIFACLIAGTDENGARLSRGQENADLLDSFVVNRAFADLSYYFVEANWNLRIGGVPIKDYFFNPEDTGAVPDMMSRDTSALRQTVTTRTKRKRLMLTERGFLGLVPNSVAAGDVVIILKGHGRPVIATEVLEDDGSKTYRLKGEAYIAGMMMGEMMELEYRKT
ncbi:hypothetical protein CKM354_001237300 [Cercospora kikuchii]|uniref:Heterokaryon incompatibility domain-containing protein n=1 Tax=Cercospora kikuchii TaxID=84275 RepID=A0A9P3FLV7_9PEZI|nr:uncharacterized protein CKM354_001237300 [Cercospora kikuchii]GIZ49341.1 hypothetical protein CKM354_001237300 [Cercospora kikuchii]